MSLSFIFIHSDEENEEKNVLCLIFVCGPHKTMTAAAAAVLNPLTSKAKNCRENIKFR